MISDDGSSAAADDQMMDDHMGGGGGVFASSAREENPICALEAPGSPLVRAENFICLLLDFTFSLLLAPSLMHENPVMGNFVLRKVLPALRCFADGAAAHHVSRSGRGVSLATQILQFARQLLGITTTTSDTGATQPESENSSFLRRYPFAALVCSNSETSAATREGETSSSSSARVNNHSTGSQGNDLAASAAAYLEALIALHPHFLLREFFLHYLSYSTTLNVGHGPAGGLGVLRGQQSRGKRSLGFPGQIFLALGPENLGTSSGIMPASLLTLGEIRQDASSSFPSTAADDDPMGEEQEPTNLTIGGEAVGGGPSSSNANSSNNSAAAPFRFHPAYRNALCTSANRARQQIFGALKGDQNQQKRANMNSSSEEQSIEEDVSSKLQLLRGYGNVLSLIALNTTESNLSNSQSSSSGGSDHLLFELLTLCSLEMGTQNRLEPYLGSRLRKQLETKDRPDFIRGLANRALQGNKTSCEKNLYHFLLVYFGPGFCQTCPSDSVLSVLAFSTRLVEALCPYLLKRSADEWVADLTYIGEKMTDPAKMMLWATTSNVGSQPSSQFTAGEQKSDSTTTGIHSSTTTTSATTSSTSPPAAHGPLFIVPFIFVFGTQASVMYDTEFFSGSNSLSNFAPSALHDVVALLNRFAFLYLHKVESLILSSANDSGYALSLLAGGNNTSTGNSNTSEGNNNTSELLSAASCLGNDELEETTDARLKSSSARARTQILLDSEDGRRSLIGVLLSPHFLGIKERLCELVRSLYDRFCRFERARKASDAGGGKDVGSTTRNNMSSSSSSPGKNITAPTWVIAYSGTRKSNLKLTELPHCIPFPDRVTYLQEWIEADQAPRENRSPFSWYRNPVHRIRRSHIVEDG